MARGSHCWSSPQMRRPQCINRGILGSHILPELLHDNCSSVAVQQYVAAVDFMKIFMERFYENYKILLERTASVFHVGANESPIKLNLHVLDCGRKLVPGRKCKLHRRSDLDWNWWSSRCEATVGLSVCIRYLVSSYISSAHSICLCIFPLFFFLGFLPSN